VPPTDTPVPPTDTPEGPTDTPEPPTDTPIPPTDTPVSPTDTPAPTNTPGGSGNLALNQPVEVSTATDDHPGADAVDGSLATMWRTIKLKRGDPRPPEWIIVDLGTSYTISQVVLEWDADNSRYATSYTIDVSPDNVDWTTVYSTTTGDGFTDVCDFAATSARYVRLYTTVWSVEWEGNYLDEYEVYE
jgi:hypothetical protein